MRLQYIASQHYGDNAHHGLSHIQAVLRCAWTLKGKPLSAVEEAAIWWHDASLKGFGKDNHEVLGAKIFLEDNAKWRFFSKEDGARIAEAIRYHRKSSRRGAEFPSALAELLASADRELPKTGADLYQRSIHYHLDLGETPEQVAVSAYEHLREITHPEYVQQRCPRLYLDRFSREVDAAYQYVQTCSLEHVRGLVVANAVR